MSLRILITNAWLSGRSGSELYVWDLATALLNRGYTPIVYSPVLGPLADRLRAATIPVTHGGIVRELSRYDHVDAAEVSRKLRSSASLETAVDAILDVYEEVIAEWRRAKPVDSDHELRAAAAYLRTLGPDHNLKVHTYRLLRKLYFRVESVGLLRPILPSRALARRMSASIRRGD
jgi:hypothetical protein